MEVSEEKANEVLLVAHESELFVSFYVQIYVSFFKAGLDGWLERRARASERCRLDAYPINFQWLFHICHA